MPRELNLQSSGFRASAAFSAFENVRGFDLRSGYKGVTAAKLLSPHARENEGHKAARVYQNPKP